MKKYNVGYGLNLLLLVCFLVYLLSSCVTQKKVDSYLDKHPEYEAKHCADKFPVVPTSTTEEYFDSSAYNRLYDELWVFADSLLKANDSLISKPTDTVKINQPVYIIQKAIEAKLKESLKPCVDKVITKTNTVVDKARETELFLKSERLQKEKDDTMKKLDTMTTNRNHWRNRAFATWGFLVLLIVVYVAAKRKFI